MSNMYLAVSAWREILARIFTEFERQDNVSPEWLVNPSTRRRLKLDTYYPKARLAFRFVGLKAKGQGRQSDWEVMEEEQRDQTREELCRQQGVQLCLVDPLEDPVKQLDTLIRLLTRSARLVAQGDQPVEEKMVWQPRLSEARNQAEEIRRRLGRQTEQMMANLAEAWRDRELGYDNTPAPPPPSPTKSVLQKILKQFAVGERVCHTKFGQGVVTAMTGSGDDTTISILFDGDQERTFLLNLVIDKLSAA